MPYAYEKLLAEHKLQIKDLPEEVEVAILEITKAEKGLTLLKKQKEKKGEVFSPSASVSKKLKAMDTFAVRGILDYLDGKETTTAAPTTTATEIVEQAKVENTDPVPAPAATSKTEEVKKPVEVDSNVSAIEFELADLYKEKVDTIGLSDLKSKAPICYKEIFESYEAESANGIETSRFSLLEIEKEVFKLTKK